MRTRNGRDGESEERGRDREINMYRESDRGVYRDREKVREREERVG